MRITFVSNYMTQHQLPFAMEMYNLIGENFLYLETNILEDERKNMGWNTDFSDIPFVRRYESSDEVLVMESDIVICGGTHFLYIKKRLDAGKITFRYMERLYKKGRIHAFSPRGYLRKFSEHTAYNKMPAYLLCAGAYVPADFNLFNGYKNSRLKWGYFPSLCGKGWEELLSLKSKRNEMVRILWTGRMLDWKHVADAVKAVRKVHDSYSNISLKIIGNGDERAKLEKYISDNKMLEYTEVLDFMPANEIREYMIHSDIYLLTSDYNEGWGAVVNEAMDAGCAVIASHAAGAVPYLINDSENGYIYKSGDINELASLVRELCENRDNRHRLAQNAHETINGLWSPSTVAKRFISVCEKLLEGEKDIMNMYQEGPLSRAHTIEPFIAYKILRK